MKQPGFSASVGTTSEIRRGGDVILVHEPEVGSTLRTKGRFVFLTEAASQSDTVQRVSRELAEMARDDYYYDLSAGVEVSLRRAMRNVNRRASARMREVRTLPALHCACAVIVNAELYTVRIGASHVFLVRHARLFLPGDDPDELADFVHRTTTRRADALGSEPDLVPSVWRLKLEPGDSVILAAGALVDGLGADTLKTAAVTLHPRAAAAHLHNRFVAEGLTGSDAAAIIEVARSTRGAPRIVPPPARVSTPAEVAAAETIRSRFDWLWRRRPRLGSAAKAVAAPAAAVISKGVAIGLELMPRRATTLPRVPETARFRIARRRRVTTLVAVALLVIAVAVGGVVLRDYQANQVLADHRVQMAGIEDDIGSARRSLAQQRPDPDRARERLLRANSRIDAAARSAVADQARLSALHTEVAVLLDRLSNVGIDIGRVAPGSRPTQLAASPHGLYAADPGTGRLWRIHGEPPEAGVVLQRGQLGVGAPVAVAAQGEVIFAIDDQRRVWRAEGNDITEVTPPDTDRWRSVTAVVAAFNNLYILDTQSGQLWRHELQRNGRFGPGAPFITPALPPNTARSVAVDGDVWIVTTAGEIQRLRRQGLATAASRIDFTVRYEGGEARPAAIQAIAGQRSIYVLDPTGRRILRLSRDGRETGRFALPADLVAPVAFHVDEARQVGSTLHGSKLAQTDLAR